jgi:hypothetical protein
MLSSVSSIRLKGPSHFHRRENRDSRFREDHPMRNDEISSVNLKKMEQLDAVMAELLRKVLQRRFYGTASVEIIIQDGTIQQFRYKIEQVEK